MSRHSQFARGAAVAALCFALAYGARADDPAPSRHQAMKECMTKQKAADAGRTHADMRAECRDLTKNARQNVVAEKKAEENTPPARAPASPTPPASSTPPTTPTSQTPPTSPATH